MTAKGAAPAVPFFKRTRRRLRSAVIRAAAKVFALLPVALLGALGAGLGWLGFWLSTRERRRALATLAVAFPELGAAERRRIATAAFTHLGRSAGELIGIRQIDRDIEAWVEWPEASRARFDAALAKGRGVVFVTGHLGHWELLARRVGLAGYDANVVAKESWDERLTAAICAQRATARVNTIWRAKPDSAKLLLRVLRRGGFVGLLIDQDTDVKSVWVPFFGSLAKTPKGAADLVLRTGAAALVGFCVRTETGRFRFEVEEVEPPPGDDEAATLELTARFNRAIERAVRQWPEQWAWMHERWKSAPPAASPSP